MRSVFSLWLLAPARGLAVRSEVQEVQVEVASTAGFQVRHQGQAAASTAAAEPPKFATNAFPVLGTQVVVLSSLRPTMGSCENPMSCTGRDGQNDRHSISSRQYECDCEQNPRVHGEGRIVDTTKYQKGGKEGYAMKVKFDQWSRPFWIDQRDWPKFGEIFSGPFWNSWGTHAMSRNANMPGNLLAGMKVFQRQKKRDVNVVVDAHRGWAVLEKSTHLVGVSGLLWKSLPSGATNTTVLDQDLEVTFTCAEGDGGRDHTHVSTLHKFKHFTSDMYGKAIHIAYDAGESLVLPKTLFGGGNYACAKLSLVIKQTIWQEGKSDPRTPSGKFILGTGLAENVRLPDHPHSVAFEFTQSCAADPEWKPSASDWRDSPFCFKDKHGLFIWDVNDSTGHQTATTTRSIFYLEDPRGKPVA